MAKVLIILALLVLIETSPIGACNRSRTTVSGTKAPGRICSGQLIFEDNFDNFDLNTWKHENTLAGGGNWEFQWYTNNRTNSFVNNGILKIKPTLTSEHFGEQFLRSGRLSLPANICQNKFNQSDCERRGTSTHIVNPIKSAKIHTKDTFAFKYGTVEIKAKMPAGDWLWPAIWLLPKSDVYGDWPRSGEIDIVESRGNRELFNGDTNVGVEQFGSTLHYGPSVNLDGWTMAHYLNNKRPGFNTAFHIYKLVWSPEAISFSVDGVENIINTNKGFWNRGKFDTSTRQPNIWNTPNAPFDQEFYLILNNAVGGMMYFADSFRNKNHKKPWKNDSPNAATEFWNARNDWLPTWKLNQNNDAALQVDYVRVYAL